MSSICECCTMGALITYILLSVPPPTMRVVPHPDTTQLFTTQQLNITCFTTLHSAVDTAVGVANTWSGPAGVISSDGHVTVVSVAGTNLEFNSALRFSSLQSSDSGTYSCFSVVSLVSSYIVSSDSVSASVAVTACELMAFLARVYNVCCVIIFSFLFQLSKQPSTLSTLLRTSILTMLLPPTVLLPQ